MVGAGESRLPCLNQGSFWFTRKMVKLQVKSMECCHESSIFHFFYSYLKKDMKTAAGQSYKIQGINIVLDHQIHTPQYDSFYWYSWEFLAVR